MAWVGLQSVIVVFLDNTHLLLWVWYVNLMLVMCDKFQIQELKLTLILTKCTFLYTLKQSSFDYSLYI